MAHENSIAKTAPRMFYLEDVLPNPQNLEVYVDIGIVTEVHITDTFANVFVSTPRGMYATTRQCGEALIVLMNGGDAQ